VDNNFFAVPATPTPADLFHARGDQQERVLQRVILRDVSLSLCLYGGLDFPLANQNEAEAESAPRPDVDDDARNKGRTVRFDLGGGAVRDVPVRGRAVVGNKRGRERDCGLFVGWLWGRAAEAQAAADLLPLSQNGLFATLQSRMASQRNLKELLQINVRNVMADYSHFPNGMRLRWQANAERHRPLLFSPFPLNVVLQ
jgi:hypothetical protein